MRQPANSYRLTFLVFTALVTLFIADIQAVAQKDKYKPGDKIEYKVPNSYPEVWETGTYVGAVPDGSQPIIREKPNEFYPGGFERAYSWDKIRPIKARPQAPAENQPNQPNDKNPGNRPVPKEPDKNENPAACNSLLSQADILSFLNERLGNDPFKDSAKKERTEKQLAAMIRKCGVNFRYETLSKFGKDLSKYGAVSTVTFPLMANFGAPTKQAWYIGTWNTSVTSVGGRWEWDIAAKTGFLTISANGTYVWKLYPGDPPAKYVKGSWRQATEEEMAVSYQGGAGIVLLKGKEGYDWLVRQDRETTLAGDWIEVANLNYRQQREAGKRR